MDPFGFLSVVCGLLIVTAISVEQWSVVQNPPILMSVSLDASVFPSIFANGTFLLDTLCFLN